MLQIHPDDIQRIQAGQYLIPQSIPEGHEAKAMQDTLVKVITVNEPYAVIMSMSTNAKAVVRLAQITWAKPSQEFIDSLLDTV